MSLSIHLLQPSITVLSSCVCRPAQGLHTRVPVTALPQARHESKLAWARGMGIKALGKVQAITFVFDQLRLLFGCVVIGDRHREGLQLSGLDGCAFSSALRLGVMCFAFAACPSCQCKKVSRWET